MREPITGDSRTFWVILLRGFCVALFRCTYVYLSFRDIPLQLALRPCQALRSAQLELKHNITGPNTSTSHEVEVATVASQSSV
jgi:hypothetical protein